MEAPAIAGARDSCPRFVAIGGIEIPRSRKIVSTQRCQRQRQHPLGVKIFPEET
jgi:hypothetical protein